MKKLSVKEDWPLVSFFIILIIGFILLILDFIIIQKLQFQFSIYFFIVIPLLLFGGIIDTLVRKALKNAGFKYMLSSMRLQTVEDHILITDGLFKYIRHPLYLGGIFQYVGGPFLFTSFISLIFMLMLIPIILLRIQIEEKMLLEEFGEEYEEYKKRTKLLIPFIY